MNDQLVLDEFVISSKSHGFPLSSHQLMLADRQRVQKFARALSRIDCRGKTIVDAGTGSGVLAMIACKLGAKQVFALDSSPILAEARKIARANKADRIRFINVDLLDDPLPAIQADVIVCELLGSAGLDENIAPAMDRLARHVLKPGGLLIPNSVTVWACPIQSDEVYRSLRFWSRRRFGLRFDALQEASFNAPYAMPEADHALLSEPQPVLSWTAGSDGDPWSHRGSARFAVTSGSVHGFMIWFTAQLTERIAINNSSQSSVNHWGQVFLPAGDAISIRSPQELDLRLSILRSGWRWSIGRRNGNGHSRRRFTAAI